MVIYNVSVNVSDDIHDEWLEWMRAKHLPDVLATGCFQTYRMFRLFEPERSDGHTYIIQYECKSINEFETYQKKYAKELQSEHMEKFKDKFTAFRTLMEEI